MSKVIVVSYSDGYYVWRPLVLENNKGERIWIHIPYTKWVNWTSLQKK